MIWSVRHVCSNQVFVVSQRQDAKERIERIVCSLNGSWYLEPDPNLNQFYLQEMFKWWKCSVSHLFWYFNVRLTNHRNYLIKNYSASQSCFLFSLLSLYNSLFTPLFSARAASSVPSSFSPALSLSLSHRPNVSSFSLPLSHLMSCLQWPSWRVASSGLRTGQSNTLTHSCCFSQF